MRTFESVRSHGLDCSSDLVCWMRGAAIKRLSRAKRKCELALCTDSTQCVCESWFAAADRLTGFGRNQAAQAGGRSPENVRQNLGSGLNLIPTWTYLIQGEWRIRAAILSLDQIRMQIDQGDQGGADAGGDQGVVGPEVGLRIERWLGTFCWAMVGGLRQAAEAFVKQITSGGFLCGMMDGGIGTGRRFGLVTARTRTDDGSAAPAYGDRRSGERCGCRC